MHVLDTLQERGFIEKKTHDRELFDYLNQKDVTCYIGFDPTASSLHIGSLIPIMSLAHMQRHGHRPIALVGGGTGLVGDPSGKTEMRKLLTPDMVAENTAGIKNQLSRFINFNNDNALLLNNAKWVTQLKYIPFLRDIGRHFSINRMIKAESYKKRLESEEGLNFIEFNYMILQAYDFLVLLDNHECMLQMGGSDQWGNIVAGIELIRKVRQKTVFGVTFPLITTSNGEKMGKTAKGAVWLDPEKTSPYEYYQYWINTDDRDVVRFLSLFTFLPIDEIKDIENVSGSELNMAKAILAFETTSLAHGYKEAVKAYEASSSVFGKRIIPETLFPSSRIPRKYDDLDTSSVPTSELEKDKLREGIPAFKLFHSLLLSNSRGAARRLIEQGGGYVNGKRISTFDELITIDDIQDNEIMLRAGKKKFHRIRLA